MTKLSGELVNTLNFLPITELDEVIEYIKTLKQDRKKEIAEEYKNEFTKLFFRMLENGFNHITFSDTDTIDSFNLDLIDVVEIL